MRRANACVAAGMREGAAGAPGCVRGRPVRENVLSRFVSPCLGLSRIISAKPGKNTRCRVSLLRPRAGAGVRGARERAGEGESVSFPQSMRLRSKTHLPLTPSPLKGGGGAIAERAGLLPLRPWARERAGEVGVFHLGADGLEHAGEVVRHVAVPEADDAPALRLQLVGAGGIPAVDPWSADASPPSHTIPPDPAQMCSGSEARAVPNAQLPLSALRPPGPERERGADTAGVPPSPFGWKGTGGAGAGLGGGPAFEGCEGEDARAGYRRYGPSGALRRGPSLTRGTMGRAGACSADALQPGHD